MSKVSKKIVFSRDEMYEMNVKSLKNRGVDLESMAEITYTQQSKYTSNISKSECLDSIKKVLSYRDVFHFIQFATEVDRLVEEKAFKGPIQDILMEDLGLFGIDETLGLDLAGFYGTIGKTNFGDIDVNKPGIVSRLNEAGKEDGVCHTFLDDIVGAIIAAASTRVAQVMNEDAAMLSINEREYTIFDFDDKNKK